MPYQNLTHSLVKPAEHYISQNWAHSEDANVFQKHVLARGGYLLLSPCYAITSALDTIMGIGSGIGAIATGGTHWTTYKFSMLHLDSSRRIVVYPFASLLGTLNPQAKFSNSLRYMSRRTQLAANITGKSYEAFITGSGDGFIADAVSEPLKNVARRCYNSDNPFTHHVASRLTYLILIISSVVTRAIDEIIGIIAGTFSLLTLGKVESINNLAYRALQAPGIVKDLFYCTTKFINPWAGTGMV